MRHDRHGARARLEARRSILKAVGGSAVAMSVGGLAACGGGNSPPPAREPATGSSPAAAEETAGSTAQGGGGTTETAAEPSAAAAETAADTAADAAGELPRLDQSDPQAQSLAYVENAESIDPSEQPRYEAGQACRNCALYLGDENSEWGPCSIFPGRRVSAAGWCNVYAPKA